MELVLTRLTERDITQLEQLNDLFGRVFEDAESYHKHKPSQQYLADFLRDKNNIALIAKNGDKLVGGLVAYTLVKFEQERKEVYLYDLAVASDVQRQGIGKKLMNELRRIAQELGAYVVFVQADEGDDAIYFYESLKPSENSKTRNFDFDL